MKNSIKRLTVLCLILFVSITTSNAAISSSSRTQIKQDSSLLILGEEEEILYAFKKGEEIIFTDNLGKYKAEIIGFHKDELVIRYLNTNKISRVMPSKFKTIKKSVRKERNFRKILSFLGLGTLATIISSAVASPKPNTAGRESAIYNGMLLVIVLLFLVAFGLIFLLTWAIYRIITRKKRKAHTFNKNFKTKIVG